MSSWRRSSRCVARRRVARGVCVALCATLLTAAPTPAEGDPPVCAAAISSHGGDALIALAEAEQAQWRIARSAENEVRRLMRRTMGMGKYEGSLTATARLDALYQRFEQAVRAARTLCGCRARRNDPNRKDCDDLYRKWLRPEDAPSAAHAPPYRTCQPGRNPSTERSPA